MKFIFLFSNILLIFTANTQEEKTQKDLLEKGNCCEFDCLLNMDFIAINTMTQETEYHDKQYSTKSGNDLDSVLFDNPNMNSFQDCFLSAEYNYIGKKSSAVYTQEKQEVEGSMNFFDENEMMDIDGYKEHKSISRFEQTKDPLINGIFSKNTAIDLNQYDYPPQSEEKYLEEPYDLFLKNISSEDDGLTFETEIKSILSDDRKYSNNTPAKINNIDKLCAIEKRTLSSASEEFEILENNEIQSVFEDLLLDSNMDFDLENEFDTALFDVFDSKDESKSNDMLMDIDAKDLDRIDETEDVIKEHNTESKQECDSKNSLSNSNLNTPLLCLDSKKEYINEIISGTDNEQVKKSQIFYNVNETENKQEFITTEDDKVQINKKVFTIPYNEPLKQENSHFDSPILEATNDVQYVENASLIIENSQQKKILKPIGRISDSVTLYSIIPCDECNEASTSSNLSILKSSEKSSDSCNNERKKFSSAVRHIEKGNKLKCIMNKEQALLKYKQFLDQKFKSSNNNQS